MDNQLTLTPPAEPAEARRDMHLVITGFLNENHCNSTADQLTRALRELGIDSLHVHVLPMTPAEAGRLARRLRQPANAARHLTRDGVLPPAGSGPSLGDKLLNRLAREAARGSSSSR